MRALRGGRHDQRAALERAGIEPHEPDYVVMGQVLQGGAGQAPARLDAVALMLSRLELSAAADELQAIEAATAGR